MNRTKGRRAWRPNDESGVMRRKMERIGNMNAIVMTSKA